MKIKHVDPIYCQCVDKESRDLVYEILSYQVPRWVMGKFTREKIMQTKSYLDKRTGYFLSGFLDRVIKELLRKGAPIQMIDDSNEDIQFMEPSLPGITFREDQMELLRGVSRLYRGYLKSATGTGKTILAAGIHSMIPGRTLFLCHTIDLLDQTSEEFRKFGFDVITIGGGKKCVPILTDETIIVTTVQTWSKLLEWPNYVNEFKTIIIDECQHLSNIGGPYAKILQRCLAPIRIGLTATDQTQSKMVIEGYLGPMIGEFTVQQGISAGVLSEPQIHWISVAGEDRLYDLSLYKEIYEKCVVSNRIRNRLIITEALKEVNKGKSVLILVKQVEHAKNLLNMANVLGLHMDFVWSETKREDRMALKNDLENKDKYCVIASTVWKEGINIQSLDCVINAAGGKSEIATLQNIGRGLRATQTKKEVIIKDFVDTYKYLNHHTIMRLQVYVDNKWTMRGG